MLHELARLPQGLKPDEFHRACTSLTTSVVFGAESLRSRAGSLTRDVAVFGRVRPISELRARLAALTLEDVNAFLAGYNPVGHATVTTLGPVDPGGPLAESVFSLPAEVHHA
ncbi:hypothetical protein ACFSC4_11975 [Deinococcus malanensis]